MKSIRSLRISTIIVFALGVGISETQPFPSYLAGENSALQKATAKEGKTFAQKLVEEVAAKHPEITGLEVAATPPGKQCMTIAAIEAKEIGEKCDKDEFTALRTQRPFVEKEADGFDVTLPLHDVSGKLIGTAGMDFKPEPGQQEATVVDQAQRIIRELEKQIPSKSKLIEQLNPKAGGRANPGLN